MYAYFPLRTFPNVTSASRVALAMPKSVSLTSPKREMRMFEGLMSRCDQIQRSARLVGEPVDIVQRQRDLLGDEQGQRQGRQLDAQKRPQVRPVHVVHAHVIAPLGHPQVVHLAKAPVGQPRQQLRLLDQDALEVPVAAQPGSRVFTATFFSKPLAP